MSIEQAAAVAKVFPTTAIHTSQGDLPLRTVMLAIAGAESSWTVDDDGDCGLPGPPCGSCADESGGATSWGLWQIHNVHADMLTQYTGSTEACAWRAWLFDAANNAKAALAVYNEQGLGAWSTWNSGKWSEFIGQAQAALLQASPTTSSPGSTGITSYPVTIGTAPAAPRYAPWVGWGLVGASLLAAGATVAVVETDVHWSDIVRWLNS